jgi:hypothetical protein
VRARCPSIHGRLVNDVRLRNKALATTAVPCSTKQWSLRKRCCEMLLVHTKVCIQATRLASLRIHMLDTVCHTACADAVVHSLQGKPITCARAGVEHLPCSSAVDGTGCGVVAGLHRRQTDISSLLYMCTVPVQHPAAHPHAEQRQKHIRASECGAVLAPVLRMACCTSLTHTCSNLVVPLMLGQSVPAHTNRTDREHRKAAQQACLGSSMAQSCLPE